MERKWGPQLPSFCQGWAEVFIRKTGMKVTIYTMQRGKQVGEKVNKKSKLNLPVTDCAASYTKVESPVNKGKAEVNRS